MESLPYETLFNVLLPLPYQEIITFCQINRQYFNICQDLNFWATKAYLELKVPFEQFYQTSLAGPDRYLQLLAELNKICLPGSERSVDVNICLGLASSHNNLNLVKYFLEQGANNLEPAFLAASANGHLEMLKYLVSIMIPETLVYPNVLSDALLIAASHQHQNIIDYLIYLGNIFHYNFPTIENLNNALINTADTGNIKLFDYLLLLGANNLEGALYNAAEHNQKNLVTHIINLAQKTNYDLDLVMALLGAASGGHKELLDYILRLDSTLNDIEILDGALVEAATNGHKEMIDYLLFLGAADVNLILTGAAYGGQRQLVDYALSLGATKLNKAVEKAIEGGHNNLIPYLISLCAINGRRYR